MQKLHDFITNGLVMREKMRELAAHLHDKKLLPSLLQGQTKIEKACTPEERDEVAQMLAELQPLRTGVYARHVKKSLLALTLSHL